MAMVVRFNREEAQDLQKKAKKACLSEAGLIRLLASSAEILQMFEDFYRSPDKPDQSVA